MSWNIPPDERDYPPPPRCPECDSTDLDHDVYLGLDHAECRECGAKVNVRPPEPDPDDARDEELGT